MSEHTALVKAAAEGEAVVQRVIDLWNSQGGWIPGAAYEELAEVLGVSTDRLVHHVPGSGRHVPPGVKQTIEARDIKPRDHLTVLDVDVDSISHLEEFHVVIRWSDRSIGVKGLSPIRMAKVQRVTVVRS
jgi:hypothetical protein